MTQDRIDAIFRKHLMRWGLRGDPVLWDLLHHRMSDRGLPDTEDGFMTVLADDYADIVGHPLSFGKKPIGVQSLRGNKGGMSNGMVSPNARRDWLMPRLRARYRGEQDTL